MNLYFTAIRLLCITLMKFPLCKTCRKQAISHQHFPIIFNINFLLFSNMQCCSYCVKFQTNYNFRVLYIRRIVIPF